MKADFKVPFAFQEPFEKPPKEKEQQTKALEEDENQEDLNG